MTRLTIPELAARLGARLVRVEARRRIRRADAEANRLRGPVYLRERSYLRGYAQALADLCGDDR